MGRRRDKRRIGRGNTQMTAATGGGAAAVVTRGLGAVIATTTAGDQQKHPYRKRAGSVHELSCQAADHPRDERGTGETGSISRPQDAQRTGAALPTGFSQDPPRIRRRERTSLVKNRMRGALVAYELSVCK
jgi:hypothetical protein